MECSCRFTAAEGGARLASAARTRNTLAAPPAEHAAFIATRLLHETAYMIRGSLFDGRKRSVYVTRATRVPCVAYDLAILTDLTICSARHYEDVYDWYAEVDKKEVLVCTSEVLQMILREETIKMCNINLIIIESCHLVCNDDNLKYVMRLYKECNKIDRPRILALTYPLFAQDKRNEINNSVDELTNDTSVNNSENNIEIKLVDIDVKDSEEVDTKDNVCNKGVVDDKIIEEKYTDCEVKDANDVIATENSDILCNNNTTINENLFNENNESDCEASKNLNEIGVYKNMDDFEMYEKLEWKLEVLEHELCCEADLAEDIDGVKRLSASLGKPREQIVEYGQQDSVKLPNTYQELDAYMRATVEDVLEFLNEHRYDPTEIYGEDLYDEIKNIPDPTLEPKHIFKQFLYILDELGPYSADKAAFSLLTKLEKLKIKVPYERHFLLLCMCTSVFVKMRCAADLVFQDYENDWDKIKNFSTSKLLRFVEILEKFKPPTDTNVEKKIESKNNAGADAEVSNKQLDVKKMFEDIDACDFVTLSNKIEDRVNIIESDLKEIVDLPDDHGVDIVIEQNINDKFLDKIEIGRTKSDKNDSKANLSDNVPEGTQNKDEKTQEDPSKTLGFQRRPHRVRGRGRVPRNNPARLQNQQNPDALCSIVFMQEPLMAKILFIIVVELSRHHPNLKFLCGQYCAIENPADPVKEPREFENQRRKQEEVLKKFRMHECNLLLATSALEEGIDLPRCNLVLRWDIPSSYRSYGLCRNRARAPRSACVVLSRGGGDNTERLLQHVATYKELDQIVSRKCGCGVQNEPPQSEENHADKFNPLVKPYMPINKMRENCLILEDNKDVNQVIKNDVIEIIETEKDLDERYNLDSKSEVHKYADEVENNAEIKDIEIDDLGKIGIDRNDLKLKCQATANCAGNEKKQDSNPASVDMNSAIALINRYCGKLPSDTFTRLAPQWWIEEVKLPLRRDPTQVATAYVCTLRLPLNCPVKYNIVGHPMPSRVLARRMVALQACRILHLSGELDNQLMPIGKENFKAPEFEYAPAPIGDGGAGDAGDLARPGTTKRRQYYYKRTASAFTDCQPVIDANDPDLHKNGGIKNDTKLKADDNGEAKKENVKNCKRNVLYAISCKLWCALPERYNTRGRRLHAPQHARQALAILMARPNDEDLQIPAFPVYTRSGEVRVSVERVADADVRMSPRRGRFIRRFMRFVFAEVLRVRRRGMRLQSEGSTHNNYYIVPTVKTTREDGSTKIDVDWPFLELIYKYTEEKKNSEIETPLFWHQEDEEEERNENNGKIVFNAKEENLIDNKDPDKNTDEEKGAKIEYTDSNKQYDMDEKDIETENITKISECNCKINENDDVKQIEKNENKIKPEVKELLKEIDTKLTHDESPVENGQSNKKEINSNTQDSEEKKGRGDKPVKKMENPLLAPRETFVFDAEKYREAVVTPWYRNQDQPQFFLVAEICWSLTPESAFPSATHTTFRSYYSEKYGVALTQPNQPLLDVDHTSARLNLLTPRYVNRKGVALPVSSERTRRAKRDRLDQKQILVPELCRVHPFAAPLWFSTVALPCVLYRINALLIADEIRRSVAIDVGLGIPKIDDATCPGFEWPPLDFGWSLAEVLNVNESEKSEKKKEVEDVNRQATIEKEVDNFRIEENVEPIEVKNKTLNDILQEKEDAESGFEIGTWSNDMASSLPTAAEYDEYTEPLPPNLTFCTSASGGTNWCDPVPRPVNNFNPSRTFSVADSDCSYLSSDFDTDDSDLDSDVSDDDIDTDGFSSSKNTNEAMGVRIEYKTAHEAEAVDVKREKHVTLAPQPDGVDDAKDRKAQDTYLRQGDAPKEYLEKFRRAVDDHKYNIIDNGLLVKKDDIITEVLPDTEKDNQERLTNLKIAQENDHRHSMYDEMFPYATVNSPELFKNGQISIENIERSKRALLADLKKQLSNEEIDKLNLYSMLDVDIDSPAYVNEKLANIGFDDKKFYVEKLNMLENKKARVFSEDKIGKENENKIEFDFDYQPKLEGHPGPSPSVILQALTMSNANDGINLERLETIGDSFLKFAITAYLYCAHPTVHEGKLSHMRSKQVSNLNLYRLGRNKRLGARMIASKFEPHDNWLPPCHRPPPTLSKPNYDPVEAGRSQCLAHNGTRTREDCRCHHPADCYIPYNLITQHSIPDKSIADCVEALIGAYLIECGPRGALLFMSWLGIKVLPRHEVELAADHPYAKNFEIAQKNGDDEKILAKSEEKPKRGQTSDVDSDCSTSDEEGYDQGSSELEEAQEVEDWSWPGRAVGSLRPYKNENGQWVQPVFGELKAPPSPLLRYIEDPDGELDQMLSGYEALEDTLQYRFRDRSLLLQALTHASHHQNRLTDCYQRLEFLGDAILDYLITRHLYEDERRHSPGALTDLRSALVNNTIFATLAVRHGFHKYFRHMSPGLNEVLTRYVKIQEENGHSISEEHYLIQEDELEQAEDVEVPKALGDLFESVAGAIFLDSGMSLGAVWSSYVRLMGAELEAFSAAAPKSPVRELLEAEPDTAKFGKPERLADGRRVRVCVEVFGRGTFKGVGRNYRIAKGTAARCALRHLRRQHRID